ncbi:zinc metalloprotease [Diaporthe australafricana]|uniref:Ste24 endopeptidase n=1 Tax=Diaporthe australafricana TaxID=127596 RepID=A0ABR3Y1E6_9PEZI
MNSLSAELWHIVASHLSIEDATRLRLASRFFADVAGTHILPEVTFYMHGDDLARLRGIAANSILAPNVKSVTYFAMVYESPAVPFEGFVHNHEESLRFKIPLSQSKWATEAEPADDAMMKLEYENYQRMVVAQDRIKDDMADLVCLKDAFARFTSLKHVTMSSNNLFYEGWTHHKPSPFQTAVRVPSDWTHPEGVRHLEVMLEALAYNKHSVKSLRAGTFDYSFFDKSSTELARLFRPVLNAVYVDLEISMELDNHGNDIDDNTEKCRRLLERGMLRDLLGPMKKLDTLCVVFHGDFGSSNCPATLKDVIGPSHHWPHLTHLELSKIECDRQALFRVLELHKDTLRRLCLQDIDLGETSWEELLPDIRKTLYLEDACVCGTLTGRSEDTAGDARLESWDVSVVGLWENDMRASINLYCRNNGKDYPDELPLTEEVVRKYFDQYVRRHVKKSEAEDMEAQREADADQRRRMQERGLIPLSDDEGSEIASSLEDDDLDDPYWYTYNLDDDLDEDDLDYDELHPDDLQGDILDEDDFDEAENANPRLARFLDRPLFPWKKLIIGFSVAQYLFEGFLSLRQYQVLKKTKPPKVLEQEISQETYDKSQAYGRAKAKFQFVNGIWGQVTNIAFIHFDILPKIWSWSGDLLLRFAPARFSGEISHSIAFVLAFTIIHQLLSLPASVYNTFVLEEKFGFNKQTPQLFVSDLIKSLGLTFVLTPPILAAFLAIIQKTGDQFFYYLWMFGAGLQVVMITIWPIVIMPLFNKLTPLEPGKLKTGVEALAAKLKFPLNELYVIDGSKRSAHSNAYFFGMPWKKHIVIYDTLIEKSETQEVVAVLAHELGHWSLGHTTRLFGISQFHFFYIFSLFSVFINNQSLYADFGFNAVKPIIVGFILFSDVLAPMDVLIKLGMNVLSRRYEFQADAFACDLGYSADLAKSLIKLQVQNLSTMDADPMFASYHFSHPILSERLKALDWQPTTKVAAENEKDGVAKATGRDEL